MTVAKSTGGYPFSIGMDAVCSALRKLADDIEAGDIYVSGVTQNTRCKLDDYEVRNFVLRYTRKIK